MRSVSVGVVLSQRRTQLTGIEPAIGWDAVPPLNRNWEGRPTSVYRRETRMLLASIEWMLARTGDGGGMNKR